MKPVFGSSARSIAFSLALILTMTPVCKAVVAVSILGAGANSCGKWLAAKDDQGERLQYEQWISGFISGFNWATTEQQVTVPDSESAVAFVDRYCENNPSHTVVYAGAALLEESGGPKATHVWKK